MGLFSNRIERGSTNMKKSKATDLSEIFKVMVLCSKMTHTEPQSHRLSSRSQDLRLKIGFPCDDARLEEDPIDVESRMESLRSLHCNDTGLWRATRYRTFACEIQDEIRGCNAKRLARQREEKMTYHP
jgi:hypothetical protein